MKRIALLGFIVFIVPVLIIISCSPGSCGEMSWTYNNIQSSFFKDKHYNFYSENDTIVTDTMRVWIDFHQAVFGVKYDCNSYSANATEPCEPTIHNNMIKAISFGLITRGNTNSIDTTIMNNCIVETRSKNEDFVWRVGYDKFISERINTGLITDFKLIIPSPHPSESIQFIILAIKENGDTLKAISQKVFCK